MLAVPKAFGLIHDPEGAQLSRCFVYVGPYKLTKKPIESTSAAKDYFGSGFDMMQAIVDVPTGNWNPVGRASQVLYYRPGQYAGRYYHLFEKNVSVTISKCRNHFCIELPGNCVVNWRGFVYP